MTDQEQVNSTYDVLEGLIRQYESGIDSPAGSVAFLQARSELESKRDLLTSSQDQELARIDRKLAVNSASINAELGDLLRSERGDHPSSEWWWYLDVLAPAGDYLGPKPPSQRERLINNLLNVFMVAALGIALFVLARNLGVNFNSLIPQRVEPTATAEPLPTSAPTATLDPQGLDFSTAKIVSSQSNVLQVPLPNGWGETQRSLFGQWEYAYPIADPAGLQAGYPASFSVTIDTEQAVYQNVFGLEESVVSPDEAIRKFKATAAANPQSTLLIADPVPSKVGALDGVSSKIEVPQNGLTIDLRIARLEGGRAVVVIANYQNDIAAQMAPVLDQIIRGMVITPGNIPTATPTATLYALQITATSAQATIQAINAQFLQLTPSATPTVTGTADATGAATQSATGGATVEATSAATGAATAVGTLEATSAATSASTAEVAPAATQVPTQEATSIQMQNPAPDKNVSYSMGDSGESPTGYAANNGINSEINNGGWLRPAPFASNSDNSPKRLYKTDPFAFSSHIAALTQTPAAPTLTPTLYSLQITATALQGQFLTLTPQPTKSIEELQGTIAALQTGQPSPTLAATATINPAGLDMDRARSIELISDVLLISLPRDWVESNISEEYAWTYQLAGHTDTSGRPDILYSVYYGESENVYARLQVTGSTAAEAYQDFRERSLGSSEVKPGADFATTVGQLPAVGFRVIDYRYYAWYETRAVDFPDGYTLMTIVASPIDLVSVIKPVTDQINDLVVFNANALSTPDPTATTRATRAAPTLNPTFAADRTRNAATATPNNSTFAAQATTIIRTATAQAQIEVTPTRTPRAGRATATPVRRTSPTATPVSSESLDLPIETIEVLDEIIDRGLSSQDGEGGFTIGAEDAPVDLVVYSSFACAPCRTFYQDTILPSLTYVDAGQLKITYIMITTTGEYTPDLETKAAFCAGEQDEFWQYQAVLFDGSGRRGADQNDLSLLRDIALALDVDGTEYDTCIDENDTTAIDRANERFVEDGGTGTPYVILDGEVTTLNAVTLASYISEKTER